MGPIVIVEVHRNGSEKKEPDEYVEIKNAGSKPQDMTGWRLEGERRGRDNGQIFLGVTQLGISRVHLGHERSQVRRNGLSPLSGGRAARI